MKTEKDNKALSRRQLLAAGAGAAGVTAGAGLLGRSGGALAASMASHIREDLVLSGGQPLKATLTVSFPATPTVLGFTLSLWGYSVASEPKPSGGGGAGKAVPNDVTITAAFDVTSFGRFAEMFQATVPVEFEAKIRFVPTKSTAKSTLQMVFGNAVVTAVNQYVLGEPLAVHKGGGDLLQVITFKAASLSIDYTQ